MKKRGFVAYAVYTEGRASYTKSASAGTSLNRTWKTGFNVFNVSQFKMNNTDCENQTDCQPSYCRIKQYNEGAS